MSGWARRGVGGAGGVVCLAAGMNGVWLFEWLSLSCLASIPLTVGGNGPDMNTDLTDLSSLLTP